MRIYFEDSKLFRKVDKITKEGVKTFGSGNFALFGQILRYPDGRLCLAFDTFDKKECNKINKIVKQHNEKKDLGTQ